MISVRIVTVEIVQASPEKPDHWPPYKKHPEKTVREVEEAHAKQKLSYDKWLHENKRLTRSFKDRLLERGFVGLWQENPDVLEVRAFWGHNHGLTLNYEHVTYPDV
jgi:hypothetical protein